MRRRGTATIRCTGCDPDRRAMPGRRWAPRRLAGEPAPTPRSVLVSTSLDEIGVVPVARRRQTDLMRRAAVIRGVLLVVVGISLFLWAKGSRNRTYQGVLQLGEEKEAFYQGGDCSAWPAWFEIDDRDVAREFRKRWDDLGRPRDLHVKFVGDKSRIGSWGHLGKYVREARPRKLLEVALAPHPCPR